MLQQRGPLSGDLYVRYGDRIRIATYKIAIDWGLLQKRWPITREYYNRDCHGLDISAAEIAIN